MFRSISLAMAVVAFLVGNLAETGQRRTSGKPYTASTVLYDDFSAGCATEFMINRKLPAVKFQYKDRDDFVLGGSPADKWIKQWDQKPDHSTFMGGAFSKDPVVDLPNAKDGTKQYIVRFALGVMFVRGKTQVILDRAAVKKWEKDGGYNKLGFPAKDNFKAGVKVVPPTKPGSSA